MIYKIAETLNDNETETLLCNAPGLRNPETYVLPHSRFTTYMVLLFSDLNKARIYEMPFRNRLHHQIEIFMSFIYWFQPYEHTEDYHIRKPNDRNFVFEIEDKKSI